MVYIHSEKPIKYAVYPVSKKFTHRFILNSSNVRLIDDGALSPLQWSSSNASSFHASLLQAIDGVMFLALCPQVVFQAPQHSALDRRSSAWVWVS